MKKIHTFLLTLLLVSVIVNISSSTAVFYDFTELNYTYEVVNSEWDIQLGVLSTTSSGLYFGENNYPVGSKYDLQILAHTPLTVDYNTTMGTDTEENTDTCHTSPLVDLVRLPGYLMLLNESWDQALFDDGPPKIFGTHFFALDNYSSIFSASVDAFSLKGTLPDESSDEGQWMITSYGAHYEEDGSKGIFDYFGSLTIENIGGIGTNDLHAGRYDLKIEFDLTTGVLNGYLLLADFNGTYDGKDIDIYVHQQIELEGYRMGKFYYNKGLPGFELFIAIPAISILSAFVLYFKKRKRK